MARADIQSIIDRINAQAEGRQTGAFATRVYTDEPIVSRGSQMASYLPERIEQMRAIARNPETRMWPAAKLFYEQAHVMEDYEDDVPFYSTFSHYFPTYEDMSNRDLRRYFSWRTQVRQGKVSPTSLSFVFVLFYELLCGVGVSDARDGFDKICSLWQSYRVFDGKLDRHAKRWLRDYAAWHNLPVELITPYVDLEFDQAVVALKRGLATWREVSTLASSPVQDELLNALEKLSSYQLGSSRLYGERPDTLAAVTCGSLSQLAVYYDKHRKSGLVETLFGSPLAKSYPMFASAVFWAPRRHEDCTYELDEVNRSVCARGAWHREEYLESRGRNAKLGSIVRTIDQRLRLVLDYEHPLAEGATPKYLAKIIDEQIAARLEWERQREARRVRIDLGQLDQIRAAASVTREALLVDEEREDASDLATVAVVADPVPSHADAAAACPALECTSDSPRIEGQVTEGPLAPPEGASGAEDSPKRQTAASEPQGAQEGPYGLTSAELAIVSTLLEGGQPNFGTVSPDMMVDSINEKLFDLLGDTAIEFVDGGPQIIEDYLQDLRGALLP